MPRRGKYNVSKPEDRTFNGIVFDSKREMARYIHLMILENAGKIQDLERQISYPIEVNGQKICNYIADFRYRDNDVTVVEDSKGVRTPVYRLKAKLVRAVYGIEIKET